jgi:hypothetical protein
MYSTFFSKTLKIKVIVIKYLKWEKSTISKWSCYYSNLLLWLVILKVSIAIYYLYFSTYVCLNIDHSKVLDFIFPLIICGFFVWNTSVDILRSMEDICWYSEKLCYSSSNLMNLTQIRKFQYNCLQCSFNNNEVDILTENVRSKVKIEIALVCISF